MSCFAMVRRPPVRSLSVMPERLLRIPNVVPSSRFVPFRSVLPAAGPAGKRDPYFARIAGGRGRAFAPARFARLIARVREAPRARSAGMS